LIQEMESKYESETCQMDPLCRYPDISIAISDSHIISSGVISLIGVILWIYDLLKLKPVIEQS